MDFLLTTFRLPLSVPRFNIINPVRLRAMLTKGILILVITSMLTVNLAGAVQPVSAASVDLMKSGQVPDPEPAKSISVEPSGSVSPSPAAFDTLEEVAVTSGVTVVHSGPEGQHPWVNNENFVSDCPTGTFFPSIAGACSAAWTIWNDSGWTLSGWAGYDIKLMGETGNTPVYYSSQTQLCRAGDFNREVSCVVTPLTRAEFFKAHEWVSTEPWERIEMYKIIYWTLDPDIWYLHGRSARDLCQEKDGFSDNRECAMQNGANAQGAAADPISTHSGVFSYHMEDLSMQTTATSLSFLRTYSSSLDRSSALGYGWTHNHDTYLIFPGEPYGETGVVWFKAHSANEYAFKINEDGTYSSLSGVLASLTKDTGPPVTYTITTEWSETYLFDEDGKLLTWSDSEGRSFTNTYKPAGLLDRVTGPSGTRYISFDYDAQDRIQSVTDHTGRVVSFGYDASGDLVTYTDVLGGVWEYEYDADHNLTKVNDPRAITQLQIEYDAESRAVRQHNGEGELQADLTFDGDGSTTVLDGLGNSFTHTYDDRNTLIQVTDATGHTSSKEYDDNFRPTTLTNENGDTTTLTWSDNGAGLTRIEDAEGNQSDMLYDALNNLEELTDGRGYTTSFNYSGRLLTSSTDALGNATSYDYTTAADSPQPLNLLKIVADPHLRETNFTYNSLGDLVEVVDASGESWGYAYNDLGWLVKLTDTLGAITKYEYDDAGRITSITRNYSDSLPQNEENLYNIISTFRYDEVGNLVDIIDTYNRVTRFSYDDADRLISLIENYKPGFAPNQETNVETEFLYDVAGNQIAVVDPLDRITRSYYDELNRPVTLVQNLTGWDPYNSTPPAFDPAHPDENVPTTLEYDPVGNLIQVEDALGTVGRSCYDGRGLQIKSILNPTVPDPCPTYSASANSDLDIIQRWTYDQVGNLLTQINPNGASTAFSYEERNLLETVTNPLGFVTSISYDAVGNQTSLTDAEGVVTRYGYDELNRLDAVVENFNASGPSDHETNVITEYRYDDLGNLHRITDANDEVWTYNYNALSQLIRNSDPLGNIWEYDYDAAGNLTQRTDAIGFTTIFNFDALNRLRNIDYPGSDPDVTFTLNPMGNLVSMLDGLGTTTWVYDGLLRPDSITDPFGGVVGYSYDAVGNRVGITYTDSKSVTYEYDAAQRLESVTDWDSGATTYSYDKTGQLISATLPNGISSSFDWDAAGRLETLDHTFKSRNYASYAYEYDRLGSRTRAAEYLLQPVLPPVGPYTIYLPSISSFSEGDPNTYIDYDYDPLYRLTAADYDSGEYFHYTYDKVGNRLIEETHEGSSTYKYDAAHRIDNVDGVAYSWDANGNLLSDGERTFTYDHADRLNSVSNQPSAFSFGYDGLGNRYQQTLDAATTTYSLDLAAGLTQVLSDGSNTYLYGLGRIGSDASGGWGYHLGDALGSLRQLSDASGEITRTQAFEPFGAPLSSSGTDSSEFGFTGEQDDIAGLVFLRARFYDPSSGRFLTKDPFPGFSSLPASLHPYVYALNNPTNLIDPSGRTPILALVAAMFAVGFVANTVLQFNENGGWCGYNPLESLEWGVGFAATSLLLVMTVLSGGSLLGMGIQGLGVLFNNAAWFGAGMSISSVATAATVWFMTGQRPWQSLPSPTSLTQPETRTQQGVRGRVESSFAQIKPENIGSGTPTNAASRQFARSLGYVTDDAGHVIGRNLGGSGAASSGNIIPQNPSVNRGQFNQFEQMISRMVMSGKEVFVRVIPQYVGEFARPISITYQVRIDGVTIIRTFPNP